MKSVANTDTHCFIKMTVVSKQDWMPGGDCANFDSWDKLGGGNLIRTSLKTTLG